MTKVIVRFTIFIIVFSLLALFQISFPFLWEGMISELNLLPILLVSLLFFYNSKTALFAALMSGFWLDLFSFSFFGLHLISFVISIFVVDRMLYSWFTNRSIYSYVIVNILFVVLYLLTSSLLFYFSYIGRTTLSLFNSGFFSSLVFNIAWSLILSFLAFSPFSLLTKNLRPVFLEKK